MNSILKPLLLAMLLVGTVLMITPASANHTTYCNPPLVYDPLTGDPMVTICTTYYNYPSSCYYYRTYVDGPVNVYYPWTNYYCDGNSYTCYQNEVYVDTSPVRVGLC